MSRHFMFVYGTLKRGQPNHYLLNDSEKGFAKFVGRGQTVDKWPLVITSKYNIPYLLHQKDFGKRIYGEIYLVDDKMRDFLDEFESHPTYYRRLKTPVTLEDGSQLSPWMYVLLDFKPELLDLVTYEDYSSYGDHGLPYVERSERNHTNDGSEEKYEVISDVKLSLI